MTTDNLLRVSDVCRRFPGKARGRINPSTVSRWIVKGVRPRGGGDPIRLGAVRVGSRWLIHPDALDAFLAALSADPAVPPPPPTIRRKRAVKRRAAAAGNRLKAMGA